MGHTGGYRWVEFLDADPEISNALVVGFWGVRNGEDHISMWRMTVNERFEIVAADPEHGRHQWVIDVNGQIHDDHNLDFHEIRCTFCV